MEILRQKENFQKRLAERKKSKEFTRSVCLPGQRTFALGKQESSTNNSFMMNQTQNQGGVSLSRGGMDFLDDNSNSHSHIGLKQSMNHPPNYLKNIPHFSISLHHNHKSTSNLNNDLGESFLSGGRSVGTNGGGLALRISNALNKVVFRSQFDN